MPLYLTECIRFQISRLWSRLGSCQLLPQERKLDGLHVGPLRVVGRPSMTTLDIFVISHLMTLLNHAGRHFAGMSRMHPIIPGTRREQHWWLTAISLDVLIRTEFRDERPVLGFVWIAVLRHPAGPCQELVITLHIQQRDLTYDGPQQLGPLHHDRADQETAITATGNP